MLMPYEVDCSADNDLLPVLSRLCLGPTRPAWTAPTAVRSRRAVCICIRLVVHAWVPVWRLLSSHLMLRAGDRTTLTDGRVPGR